MLRLKLKFIKQISGKRITSSNLSTVFTLQAAYFSLAFPSLLLEVMPMSWETPEYYRPVQNHCSCQDTEHLSLQLWIARLQMAVKCKQCLSQLHTMINNYHFNESIVYLIATEKTKCNNKRCAVLFSCMVIGIAEPKQLVYLYCC